MYDDTPSARLETLNGDTITFVWRYDSAVLTVENENGRRVALLTAEEAAGFISAVEIVSQTQAPA